MRRAGYGWVQLHHLPRESAREGRGWGDRKRPASYQQAEEWTVRARKGGRQEREVDRGEVAAGRRKGDHEAPLDDQGGGRRLCGNLYAWGGGQ